MITLSSFVEKYSKVLITLLLLFSLLPIFLNFLLVPSQNYAIETANHSCFAKNSILNQLNESNKLDVLETGEGIYVIPEFSNLKCIGKVVDYVVNEDNILLYIGTNQKVTKLVFIFSLFVYIFYSLIFKTLNFQVLNVLSFLVFLVSFLYFYLLPSMYLNYFVLGFFVISILVYSNLRKNNFDLIEISIFIILPIFGLLQFKEKWLTWITILSLFLLLIFYFVQLKLEVNSELKFLSLLFFQSLILNLGSFLQPLRDFEHWRQNQNAFAAKTIGDEGINFLNPLPVFGISSNVPMELPILQNLSGLLQIIGLRENITLRPVAWLIYILFVYFCYKLIINISNKKVAEMVSIFFVYTPILYKFSNSYMIEFLPHLFGVLSLNLILNDKKIAPILLSLSLLSKITTGVIYLFLFACIQIFRNKERLTKTARVLSIAVFPSIVWNIFADFKKSQNSLTSWLTSQNLFTYNFGTVEQYQNIEIYRKIVSILFDNIWGSNFIIIGAVLFFYTIIKRPEIVFVWIVPFVFINLYNIHEYYFLSVIPIILFYIINSLRQMISNDKIFIIACLCILLNINFGINKNKNQNYRIAFKVNEEIEQAEKLSAKLKPYPYKNTYLSSGINDWNPIIFYESDKKGFMYLEKFEIQGNSKWDSINIERDNIELYVFQQGYLNIDHLDVYLSHQFKNYEKVKIDLFLYRPEEGWYTGGRIFYFILSPFKTGDTADLLISKNDDINNVNQDLINCLYSDEYLTSEAKYDIDFMLSSISFYQYEVINRSYNCLNESA